MRGWLIAMCVLMLGGAAAGFEDEKLDAELEKVQGKWALRSLAGRQVTGRIEKEVVGTRETTRIYQPDGTVARAQTSVMRLERTGDVRLLHWSGAVVTEGPDAGRQIPDGSAVYRFRDAQWICVDGVNEDSPFSVSISVWERLGDKP